MSDVSQRLTLDTLSVGAQIVIAPRDKSAPYEGAIVTALTERVIATTAGKFNRRNGAEWGSGDAYHYRSIAVDYGRSNGALMTWAEARERNAKAAQEKHLYRMGIEVRDRVGKEWRGLTLDQLQRIVAILDERAGQPVAQEAA